jgi:hypothetical protein
MGAADLPRFASVDAKEHVVLVIHWWESGSKTNGYPCILLHSEQQAKGESLERMPDLPDELEKRLEALSEDSAQGADFDLVSWFWLLLLGLIGPIALIIASWSA